MRQGKRPQRSRRPLRFLNQIKRPLRFGVHYQTFSMRMPKQLIKNITVQEVYFSTSLKERK